MSLETVAQVLAPETAEWVDVDTTSITNFWQLQLIRKSRIIHFIVVPLEWALQALLPHQL